MKFLIQTFGCKSNQYESQAIRESLEKCGLRETNDPADADVAVVNTCGVTGRAGASCRNAIRKLRRANPGVRLFITGCAVDLDMEIPDLPGPQPVAIPNAKKHAIADLLRDEAAVEAAKPDRLALSISAFSGHTRAFLKVQDGCDNFCSYCAVPFARGTPESRDPAEILEEAKRLVGSGHREIVLTGINIGNYRRDGLELGELALALAETPGLERLRLGSVEPPYVTPRLVRAMAATEKICPHIHLPLQSGDDGILGLMGRRYSRAVFQEKAAMLREHLKHPSLTTDVIVGFPGETESSAAATREFCEGAGFSRLHVFLFSPRPGTRAATMKRTATDAEIEAWKSGLIEIGKDLANRYAAGCVGLEERVIFEKSGTGLSDRYLRVTIPEGGRKGEVERVTIVGSRDAELLGV